MADHSDAGPDEPESMLCPHCIEPVTAFDHFCPHCAGPISAHASIDPLGQVFAAGRAYQNATTASTSRAREDAGAAESPGPSRRRRIITLGMWLIFAPQIAVLLAVLGLQFSYALELTLPGATGPVTTDFPFNNALGTVVATALLVLYVAILWKVTRRTKT